MAAVTRCSGFHQETLAPFSEEKMKQFAAAWYGQQTGLRPGDMGKRVADLQTAVTSSDLRDMAQNPMLLTTIAIIHQKNHELPRQRVLVYDEAVKLLSHRWQRDKEVPVSPSLQKVLDDPSRLRRILGSSCL
jgi:predicted NACHT family NTPase